MPATAQAEWDPSPSQEHNPTGLLYVRKVGTLHYGFVDLNLEEGSKTHVN